MKFNKLTAKYLVRLLAFSILLFIISTILFSNDNPHYTNYDSLEAIEYKKTTQKMLMDLNDKNAQEFIKPKDRVLLDKMRKSKWNYEATDQLCPADKELDAEFSSFIRGKKSSMKNMSPAAIAEKQNGWKSFLKNLKPPSRTFKGRGIVYSGHSGALKLLLVSIKVLRHHGCTLPVQIWHNDEFEPEDIVQLEDLPNVSVKNANDYRKEKLVLTIDSGRFYAMKGAALLQTDFDEVLFLDSDNVVTRDPTFLFDTPAFKETGAIFWKDFWKTRTYNPMYRILEIPCINEHQQESGQLLIKKSSPGVHEALSLAFYLQMNAKFYFYYILGDKDTFRFSWRALKVPYHMTRPFLAVAGINNGERLCGNTMVQFAPYWGSELYGPPPPGHIDPPHPEVLFYHMNSMKNRIDPQVSILQHYDPWFTEYGRGNFHRGFYGTCTHLEEFDNLKVVYTPTEELAPGFESLYYKLLTGDSQSPLKYNSDAKLKWSYEFSDDTCDPKLIKDNEDTMFVESRRTWWKKISQVDIDYARETLKSTISSLVGTTKKFSGRGVVLTAGSATFLQAKLTVKALLHYQCNLSIEIWHNNDLDDKEQEQLQKYPNVFVRNLRNYRQDHIPLSTPSHLSIRAASILYSSFDEVLYLDPNVFPVRDPEFLFDSPAFKETGAVFWKDFWRTSMDNRLYEIFSLKCFDEFQQDPSLLLVRKSSDKVFEALSLALHVQINDKFYSSFMSNGADSFRLSWRSLKLPYHMVRVYPAALGKMIDNQFCGNSIVHYAPYWNKHVYGTPPQNHRDPPTPEMIFFKYTLGQNQEIPDFDTLQIYSPRDTIIGKALRESKGSTICTGLTQTRKYGERHSPDIIPMKSAYPPGIAVLFKGFLKEEENSDDWWY